MDIDPALTKRQVEALNTVDLQLLGVTHGIIKGSRVNGIKDTDYQEVRKVVDRMRAARGDVLAVEPTGFVSLDEPPTVSSIIPVELPNGTESELSDELKVDLIELIERGRRTLRINNLAYAAVHALLKGVPVHTAEVTMDEWQNLQARLEAGSGDAATKKEEELFYRNGRMLTRLGNIAIDMTRKPGAKSAHPTLLYLSGSTHTPRLGNRLHASGVSFTSNR